MNRGELIGNKFPVWAPTRVKLNKLKYDFLHCDTFHFAKNFPDQISLILLGTVSLPFYIAIADEDTMAMFCHVVIYPNPANGSNKDVRDSVVRGFITYDQNIVIALKEVFLKFLQLNAAVYEYTCGACGNKTHKFDHELLKVLTEENLSEAPQILCEKCKVNMMTGELKELIRLNTQVRDELYQKATGEQWRN